MIVGQNLRWKYKEKRKDKGTRMAQVELIRTDSKTLVPKENSSNKVMRITSYWKLSKLFQIE